jgi:hypothetical protein
MYETTITDLESAEGGIKDHPLTIQDAIRMIREIGLTYLWVDSLVSISRCW